MMVIRDAGCGIRDEGCGISDEGLAIHTARCYLYGGATDAAASR
jgi:hypothetical protein